MDLKFTPVYFYFPTCDYLCIGNIHMGSQSSLFLFIFILVYVHNKLLLQWSDDQYFGVCEYGIFQKQEIIVQFYLVKFEVMQSDTIF